MSEFYCLFYYFEQGLLLKRRKTSSSANEKQHGKVEIEASLKQWNNSNRTLKVEPQCVCVLLESNVAVSFGKSDRVKADKQRSE